MSKNKTIILLQAQRKALVENIIFLELFVTKLHEISRESYGPQFWDVAIRAFILTELILFKNHPCNDDFIIEIESNFEELLNILRKGADDDLLS